MKLYFADGGSVFYDNSRAGYNSCSLICQTTPFPKGVYYQTCEIDDCFTEKEAQSIGDRATSYVVSDGMAIWTAVAHVEAMELEKKKAQT